MENHYRSAVQHHMALMCAKIAKQEETLIAQKETVTTMSDKVNSLCKIVSSQEKYVQIVFIYEFALSPMVYVT